ncbi:cobalt ECF transporter T component CbiQ [Planctomycetota bacterium]
MERSNGIASVAEAFSGGESLLHRMDPRVKTAGAVMFSLAAATSESVPALVVALVLSLLAVAAARLDLMKVLKRMAAVNAFVVVLWIVLALELSKQGTELALAITLKCNAIVLACTALLSTSPVVSLVHALHHFRVPGKLVHLFFFSYRYMHVIADEYGRLRDGMKLRGFVPRTNLHTYRTLAYLVGNLFVRSYDRSNRIYRAMLCRGFKGTFYLLHHFHLKRSDVAAFVVMTAGAAGIALLPCWAGSAG